MTDAKILEVLDRYQTKLRYEIGQQPSAELKHCLEMLPQMRTFIELGRRGKVFRWLGFIQGVLYCTNIYTIDEMKDHNRT